MTTQLRHDDTVVDGAAAGLDVNFGATVQIAFSEPGRALLKFLPSSSASQELLTEDLVVAGASHRLELVGEDRVVVIDAAAALEVTMAYSGVSRVHRANHVPRVVPDAHLTRLDHGAWLIPSRYCPSDRLTPTAEVLLPERQDPRLLERCREWVEANLTYVRDPVTP